VIPLGLPSVIPSLSKLQKKQYTRCALFSFRAAFAQVKTLGSSCPNEKRPETGRLFLLLVIPLGFFID
jgi:hypothetical protein